MDKQQMIFQVSLGLLQGIATQNTLVYVDDGATIRSSFKVAEKFVEEWEKRYGVLPGWKPTEKMLDQLRAAVDLDLYEANVLGELLNQLQRL